MADLHAGSILVGVLAIPALWLAVWLFWPSYDGTGWHAVTSSTDDGRHVRVLRWPWWSPIRVQWAWGVYIMLAATESVTLCW